MRTSSAAQVSAVPDEKINEILQTRLSADCWTTTWLPRPARPGGTAPSSHRITSPTAPQKRSRKSPKRSGSSGNCYIPRHREYRRGTTHRRIRWWHRWRGVRAEYFIHVW